MLKFNILDEYNFGVPYFLLLESIFDENCWARFQFKSSICGRNFSSIQDVVKIWYTF